MTDPLEIIRTCPQCGNQETTHAFQKVSNPFKGDDGTYGLCPECKVYWLLDTRWAWADLIAKDFEAAVRVSDLIINNARQVAPAPTYTALVKQLKEKS
jgi:hypothetical protein